MKAHFENPKGFILDDLIDGESSGEFMFRLNLDSPLTYHDGKGGKIQPNRKYITDLGSVPKPLQTFVAPDKYKLSFLFHDSAWEHGGLWYCAPGYEEYVFIPTSRRSSNRLLKAMIPVEAAMIEDIMPDEARRDSRHIKLGFTRRRPRHER